MTVPNEPGYPGPGDSPGRPDGATDSTGQRAGTGRITDTGQPPPWQRSSAGRSRRAGPRLPEPPVQQQPRPAGHAPGVDARLSRFVSGTPAPGAKSASGQPEPARSQSQQADAYGSELPDLSASISGAVQRKPAADSGGAGGSTVPARVADRRVQVSARSRGPVRASMQIRRIDPWSALKVSLLLSVASFFVWMIAVALLYLVLGSMGVWSKLNSNVGDLLTNTSGAGELVSSGAIFGSAVLIGLVNIVLLTAMATLGAVVYNLSTDLIGGVEVTLADRD